MGAVAPWVGNNGKYYALVKVNYSNPFLDETVVVTPSSNARVSYPDQTANWRYEPFDKIFSLDGSCTVDGSYKLAPVAVDADRYEMGWWSAEVSESDGTFSTPPVLTVTFSTRTVKRIQVVGDLKRGERPVDFVVRLYDSDGNLLHTETITVNTDIFFEKALDTPITGVSKAELEIQKWSHPSRNAKIVEFFTVLQENYTDQDIINISLTEEIANPRGKRFVGNISENEVRAKLYNRDKRFSFGNTESQLYTMLRPNRYVQVFFGDKPNFSLEQETFVDLLFHRNSVARLTDLSEVAVGVPRVEPVENKEALFIEKGTANLFTDPLVSDLDNYENDGFTATKQTYIALTSFDYVELTGSGAFGQTISVSEGNTYTFSVNAILKEFDYAGEVGLKIQWLDSSDAVISEVTQSIDRRDDWNRFNVSGTVPAGAVQAKCVVYSTSQAKIWASWFQLEEGKMTSFIDGTRESEYLEFPGSMLTSEETLEAFVYLSDLTGSHPIFYTPELWFGVKNEKLRIEFNSVIAEADMTTGWHYVAVYWKDTELKLYLDGSEVATATITQPTFSDGYIGYDGTNYLDGYVHILAAHHGTVEIEKHAQNGYSSIYDSTWLYLIAQDDEIHTTLYMYIPLGKFWTTSWKVQEDDIYAEFVARDMMRVLKRSLYRNVRLSYDKTLYDIAVNILQDAGLTEDMYYVDEDLKNITVPIVWFPLGTHYDALKTVTEAAAGFAYCDREGRIRVVSYRTIFRTPILRELAKSEIFKKTTPAKDEILNYVEVTATAYVEESNTNLYDSSSPIPIEAGETKTVTIQFDKIPVDVTIDVKHAPPGFEVQNVEVYTWGADVTVYSPNEGDFIITARGNAYVESGRENIIKEDAESIAENGYLKLALTGNHLVQTREHAEYLAEAILYLMSTPRSQLDLQWKGDLRLKPGDKLKVLGDFESFEGVIISRKVKYNGFLSDKITLRRG